MIILQLPTTPKCTICLNEIFVFRNKKSIKEFKISGFCQDCQDKTFDKELNKLRREVNI